MRGDWLRSSWLWFCAPVLAGLLGAIAVGVFAVREYGSLMSAADRLKGDCLFPNASVVDIGRIVRGQKATAQFLILNRAASTVRILGASCSCTCSVVSELPRDVGCGQKVTISVVTTGSKIKPGRFTVYVRLYTDAASQPALNLNVCGESVEAPLQTAESLKSARSGGPSLRLMGGAPAEAFHSASPSFDEQEAGAYRNFVANRASACGRRNRVGGGCRAFSDA
jgi:hypothetical protein